MWLRLSFVLYILLLLSSCNQEEYLFHPSRLPDDYHFGFTENFTELNIPVGDSIKLNALWFRADTSEGLVFYLHGNAGALNTWGEIAGTYLDNNYDFFIIDYRGYGKSGGKISSEEQLLSDMQIAYDTMKTKFREKDIVVIGYSIGTGLAAFLAANNNPKLLILKAPYYNIPDLANELVSYIPSSFVSYKLETNKYIRKTKCPVIIFHGDIDETIYYGSSKKLEKLFKAGDTLITLYGQRHNGINNNPIYLKELERLLKNY